MRRPANPDPDHDPDPDPDPDPDTDTEPKPKPKPNPNQESHATSRWAKALYVRNQKAASTFLGQVVGKLFKARVTRDLNNGQKLAHAHRLGLLKSI